MTDDVARWQRARALFDAVVDEPPDRWEPLVAHAAADDTALHGMVLRLLDASREDRFGLEHPHLALGDPCEGDERLGETVGRYRLVRLLGCGGMGTVYEGVRADGEYEQRVAVKLIRPQLRVPGMASRFRHERQILAALEHPNIARLLDGGATAAGEPFLVMEYVEGTPITGYCDARRLTIRDRLRLFVQACAAVQHAHANLVVHRDLKPANILVTPASAAAAPGVKLLDFGVAQLLGARHDSTDDASDGTSEDGLDDVRSSGGPRPLTLEYASPEQLRDEPAAVASDVYSLGVVLYELLAGRRPVRVPDRSTAAALRALETAAPPPSTGATADAATHAGEATLARLRRRLTGELDDIVARTLHPDPAQRYVSVERLADDVRRYLEDLPVRAHGSGIAYRARKLVRRRAPAVAAAVMVTIALVVGVAATAVQARRAETERAKAARINAFLQDMLSAADTRWFQSAKHSGPAVTVAEVLDDAARRAGVDLAREPAVEAAVRQTLGRTYHLMSRYDEADAQLTRALQLDRRLGAPPVPDLVTDLRDLGLARLGRGQTHAADTLFRSALALCRTHGERADTAHVCAHSLNHLGLALWAEDELPEAERLLRQTLGIARAAFGPSHPAVAIILGEIAGVRDAGGDLAGAERSYRESLAIFAAARDRDYGERSSSLGGLALTLEVQGRLTEAEALLREEDALLVRSEGPTHPDVGLNWVHLGAIHRMMGRLDLARTETARGLDILGDQLPRTDRYYTKIRTYQALTLLASGEPAQAERVLADALQAAEAKYARGDPRLAEVQDALGQTRLALGRPRDAEPLLAESAATFARRFGPDHPCTRDAARHLGVAHAQLRSARQGA